MCQSIKHLHSLVGNVKSTRPTTPLAALVSPLVAPLEVSGWMTELVTLVWDWLGFWWLVDCWESKGGLELGWAGRREGWKWFVEGGLELGWAEGREGWDWFVEGGLESGWTGGREGWDWFVEGGLELGWAGGGESWDWLVEGWREATSKLGFVWRDGEGWLGLLTPGVGIDWGLVLDPEIKKKTNNF